MLGLRDAVDQEAVPDGSTPVISKLTCSLVGQAQQVEIAPDTRAHRAYGKNVVVEQFRCSYGLNPAYRETIGRGPLQVVGVDENHQVRIVELPAHRFYIATLFLPQLSSAFAAPHPLILDYLDTARLG